MLQVSADELIFDENERGSGDDLRLHFEAVSKLTSDEKRTVKELLEGMILKHEAKRWQNGHLAKWKEDNMDELTIDDSKLKELFKQAIIEAMEEKKDMVRDLLFEAMEDVAMLNAIRNGEQSRPASREEVFEILDGNA